MEIRFTKVFPFLRLFLHSTILNTIPLHSSVRELGISKNMLSSGKNNMFNMGRGCVNWFWLP